ncbi:hypothetical protein cand_033530 [Cryptosporidium andersoni]|uniref:non-specific serine/threonine protein kinase n=1 Tax=Cryptosporidium andersoni TaxID=117008 RepID=A0A1J4MW24_9CRYT|nr:hypothetical protein cand_033530 [Cryptosporidium andersoni]
MKLSSGNKVSLHNKSRDNLNSQKEINEKRSNMESGVWNKILGLIKNSLGISSPNSATKYNLFEKDMSENLIYNPKKKTQEFYVDNINKFEYSNKSKLNASLLYHSSDYKKLTNSSKEHINKLPSPSSLGISFAEQILSYDCSTYDPKLSHGISPVTPTTCDSNSVATSSPLSTNIQTPNSILSSNKSVEIVDNSPIRVDSIPNINNYAVDFSTEGKFKSKDCTDYYSITNLKNTSLTSNILGSRQTFSRDCDFEEITRSMPQSLSLSSPCLKLFDYNYKVGFNTVSYSSTASLLNNTCKTKIENFSLKNTQINKSTDLQFKSKEDNFDITFYSWKESKKLINKLRRTSDTFKLSGIPYSEWKLEKIPTLGASPTSCRVQEMFRGTIKSEFKNSRDEVQHVFIKRVPINIWMKQWEMHEIWDGDYVTDGEDFVMEAAALAFLQKYSQGLAPKLLAVLEHKDVTDLDNLSKNFEIAPVSRSFRVSKDITHIILVSELYGDDLLDYLDRREKEKSLLTFQEKRKLQYNLALQLNHLHLKGLCHLDFTPENILVGPQGISICDFAKATPIITKYPCHTHYIKDADEPLRHIKKATHSPSNYFEFESCEPTVGKGAYMPPECWRIFWKLEENHIQYPLEELTDTFISRDKSKGISTIKKSFISITDRQSYYFKVRIADVYMLGILMFWIWSDGGIWKYSDIRQDHRYQNLVSANMNFDVFRECRTWNTALKSLLCKMLQPDPNKRITLNEVLLDPWWSTPIDHQ